MSQDTPAMAAIRMKFLVRIFIPISGGKPAPLISSDAEKNDRDGLQHDLHVEPERPVVEIFEVELHPLLKGDVVPAVDLPEARDARLHREPSPLPILVLFYLVGDGRPRTDDAHVADENVE